MTETVISSSVLILAVILVRALFGRKISRSVRYSLWGVVLMRLMMPVSLLPSPFSVMNPINSILGGIEQAEDKGDTTIFYDTTANMPVKQTDENGNFGTDEEYSPISGTETSGLHKTTSVPPAVNGSGGRSVLKLVWICGGTAAGVWFFVLNLMFYIRLRRARTPFGSGCGLPVYIVENIASPCLFGVFRPSVYLNNIAAADEEMLRHVLTHETCHRRRLDHIWSFARVVCCAVYWWDPLVWAAAVLSKTDSELACDEASLKILGEESRLAYCRTLVSMIAAKPSAGAVLCTATTMTGGKKNIAERLKTIVGARKTRISALAASLIMVAFAAGCTFTGADAYGASEREAGFALGDYKASEVIYVNPLSSFYPRLDGDENADRYYSFEKGCFTVINDSGSRLAYQADYGTAQIDTDSFRGDFQVDALIPDVSSVESIQRVALCPSGEDEGKSGPGQTGYLMYVIDDELWLAVQRGGDIWVIYRIEPYEEELPKNAMLEGARDCAEYIAAMDGLYTAVDEESELYAALYPNVEKHNADFVAESDARLIMGGDGKYIPVSYRYIGSEILGAYLCAEYSFDSYKFGDLDADTKWYVCNCPCRFKPDKLDEVRLPGGRWFDSEGWLHDNGRYFIVGENDTGFFYAGCRYFDAAPESGVMEQELLEFLLSIYAPRGEKSSDEAVQIVSEDYISKIETPHIEGENLYSTATGFLIAYGKAREYLPDNSIAKVQSFTIENYQVSEPDENGSFIIRAAFSYEPVNLSEWKLKWASNDLDENGGHREYWEFRLQKVYSPESGSVDGYVWRCTENGTGI